jgi:hypothetical protein
MSDLDDRAGLDHVVDHWLSLDEAADQLGVTPNRVRQFSREHQLVVLRRPGGRGLAVPAKLILDGQVVKGLGGTLTLLSDRGLSDVESLEWLFTADDSLPGRPIDALRENRGREVRRRAQVIV